MKYFLLFVSFLLAQYAFAQFVNPGFEEWVWVYGGQPYEDLTGWRTNNTNQPKGFASTPVRKGFHATGFYAVISSRSAGIDATGPGVLHQTISSDNLKKIIFHGRCDSIFQTGKCVTDIFGNNGGLLYTDSVGMEDTSFLLRTVDIPSAWIESNDSLTLQFTALGGWDEWDEEENGFATYMIDEVSAEYLTSFINEKPEMEINIFPNPSNGIVNIYPSQSISDGQIKIISTSGINMKSMPFASKVDLTKLPSGSYVMKITTKTFTSAELIYKMD